MRRNTLSTTIDVLKSVSGKQLLITKIMYAANINSTQLKSIVNALVEHNYLSIIPPTSKKLSGTTVCKTYTRVRYALTDNGRALLKAYAQFEEFLRCVFPEEEA